MQLIRLRFRHLGISLNKSLVARDYGSCALMGLVLSSAYWLTSLVLWGPENIAIKSIYRYGDLEAYPVIAAFAHLNFHPTYSAFFGSEGAQTFPLFVYALPALFFALFGWSAFPIVDFIYFSLAIALLDRCFRLSGVSASAARASAIICVTGNFLFIGPLSIFKDSLCLFFSMRIERPFLSSISYFLFVWIFLSCSEQPHRLQFSWRTMNRWPVAVGLSAAALIQSDIFSFVSAAAAGVLLVVVQLTTRKLQLVGPTLLGFFVVAITFSAASLPFLLQLHFGAPDLVRRFGVFALDSSNRWLICKSFLKFNICHPNFWPVFLGLYCILKWLRHSFRPDVPTALAVLAVSGFIGPLIFFCLSPSAVQVYHFQIVSSFIFVIPVFVFGAIFADLVWRRLDAETDRTRAWGLLCATIVALAIIGFWAQTARAVGKTQVMRPEHFPAMRAATFRAELTDVLSYLNTHAQGKNNLLLTNDHHVLTWWILSGRGNLLMPDVVTTTLSQAHIETQLCMAGKYLNWSRTEFLSFLTTNSTAISNTNKVISNTNNIWFLGGNLYSASRFHRNYVLTDYPQVLREQILRDEDEWQIIMPVSEVDRLGDLYDQAKVNTAAGPDFIVVLRSPLFVTSHIDTARFNLEYSGDNYLIYNKVPQKSIDRRTSQVAGAKNPLAIRAVVAD
jgi:hypothetical protein